VVFHQEFCEFIESVVVHKRLSFHQPGAMQLSPLSGGKRGTALLTQPKGVAHNAAAALIFAANAPSKPSRKGSESFSVSKANAGISARSRRTTCSFSSRSRLHVL